MEGSSRSLVPLAPSAPPSVLHDQTPHDGEETHEDTLLGIVDNFDSDPNVGFPPPLPHNMFFSVF